MKKLYFVAVSVLSLSTLASANWDAKQEAALDMQIAQYNAQYELAKIYSAQTGREMEKGDYTSEVNLISANSTDGFNALPATFEVSLSANGVELIRSRLTCARGHTNQESRFTRVTPINCSVSSDSLN